MKAPFPWFGGKSRVAHVVWDRFGDVANYVEPFAGSLAVLLNRPHDPRTETVNDIDCYLANFWRATSIDPAAVVSACDWPVNEADLHARHLWLVNQTDFRERMKSDPDYFDAKIAGWWVWGLSQWIGSGWCSRPDWTGRTNAGRSDRGIFRKIPSLVAKGRGSHAESLSQQIPHLGNSGQGINRLEQKRPMIHGGHTGNGIHAKTPGDGSQFGGEKGFGNLLEYFHSLRDRLRRVRVCCGDWQRVTGPSVTVKHGVCGVFLDPPYDMRVVSDGNSDRDGAAPTDALYSTHDNDVSKCVREWAIENGGNPLLRIALCGYEGEHQLPADWECVPWKAHGGYGSQRGDRRYENASRERIWFSPHCMQPQYSLFSEMDENEHFAVG